MDSHILPENSPCPYIYNAIWEHPSNSVTKGETPIYRSVEYSKKQLLRCYPEPNQKTVQDLFLRNFRTRPNNIFLGYRPIVNLELGTRSKTYTWLKNSEYEELSKNLGAGIQHHDFCPTLSEWQGYNLNMILIYSKNNVEWVLTDTACALYNITACPLYDTLGEQAMGFILKETNISTIFLETNVIKNLYALVKNGRHHKLKNLVVMDSLLLNKELLKILEEIKLNFGQKWHKFEDIMESGKANPKPYAKVQPDDIYTICYTSGTTGNPKGAMLTHGNFAATTISGEKFHFVSDKEQLVHQSYQPLAHIWERQNLSMILYQRGQYGIFGGDVAKLGEDLNILKPNLLISVPRLFNKFYASIKDQIRHIPKAEKNLVEKAIHEKLVRYKKFGEYEHDIYDNLVFNKLRQILGGNVKCMLSGSAPIDPKVLEFLSIVFCCPMLEGYGMTEGSAAQFGCSKGDMHTGTVGAIRDYLEFKLVDVSEMNYTSQDLDSNGKLAPRGEIVCRGNSIFCGYYKNPEKTKETLDVDGWMYSGDIGEIVPGSNALKIIDRKKNIFKLSQGEYVAPDRLQNIYKNSYGIDDIYVHGDSQKSFLIGVIVPNEETFTKLAKDWKLKGNIFKDWIRDPRAKDVLIHELNMVAKENKLKGFEYLKRIHLSEKSFQELDLITTTHKVKRNEASKAFKSVLEQLYQGLD